MDIPDFIFGFVTGLATTLGTVAWWDFRSLAKDTKKNDGKKK